jgi:hypothetical protein
MSFKTTGLRYLGGISGQGAVMRNGETVTPAKFELDGYFRPSNGVTGSGEIQVPGDALKALFGMRDLHLQTDRGLLLALRFSDLKLPAASDFVRVEVTAQPTTTPDDWRQ